MKASLKFREEQKPLFRAKVPLNILGFPFQSGIVAGESKELTLNLATFFESGPSIKIAYRPNDTRNPFSLVVKTGTGSFGSPFSSSMLMSAEFNLLGRANPTFMLHFKPQFGDFSIKKSHSSVFDRKARSMKGAVADDDSAIEVVESPAVNGGGGIGSFSAAKKIIVLPSTSAGDIAGLFSGVEMAARTALPVKERAVVNFRWGVRVPAEMKSYDPTAGFSFRKIPFLVMNKIGIEHVDGPDSNRSKSRNNAGPESGSGNAGVAEACLMMNRQLAVLQAENGLLRKAVEELHQEITDRKSASLTVDSSPPRYRKPERSGNKSKPDVKNSEKRFKTVSDMDSKPAEGDVSEELMKALKDATGA